MKKILISVVSIAIIIAVFATTTIYVQGNESQEKIDFSIKVYRIPKRTEDKNAKIINEKQNVETYTGWISGEINVRESPNIESKILGMLNFNHNITYKIHDEQWAIISYNDKQAYISRRYILDKENESTEYAIPENSGFKSFMSYKAITNKKSPQYKLQNEYATTGEYGIRTVNGRYCIAIGTHFKTSIGDYVDLILENGTVLPCIVADKKSSKHTEDNNIVTKHNGCVAEFIIDKEELNKAAKRDGDMSSCNESWDSQVFTMKIYQKNVLN